MLVVSLFGAAQHCTTKSCCLRHPKACKDSPHLKVQPARGGAQASPTPRERRQHDIVRALLRATNVTRATAGPCYSLQEDPEATVWGRCMYEAEPQRDGDDWAQQASMDPPEVAGVCGGRGVSFFGRCFCAPHFDGERCGVLARPAERTACALQQAHDDSCIRHPDYGSAIVPAKRWRQAQAAEQRAYRDSHIPRLTSTAKAVPASAMNISIFHAIPAGSLGRVIELGAGPLTQTWELLRFRPDVSVSELVIEDPGIPGYVANNLTRYASGPLAKIPVSLLPVGAEEVSADHYGTADTVVMINTIEHAFNGFALLHTAYRLLRPGGLFILRERIVRMDARPKEFRSMETHPIRLRLGVWDWLFRDSGAFARHRRSLYYADRGKTPRKKFMEECVEYLGWKS